MAHPTEPLPMKTHFFALLCVSAIVLTACGDKSASDPAKKGNDKPAAAEKVSEPEKDNLLLAWATRAKNAEIKGQNEILAQVALRGETFPVVRTGTLASWAVENKDRFATRAARYMRTMSDVTGHAYCGQICNAQSNKGGPYSIDITTSQDSHSCAAVPVCSLPNGSGIKNYGVSTGDVVLISAKPDQIAPRDANGNPYYGASKYIVLDEKGNPKPSAPQSLQYYTLETYNTLVHHKEGEKVRLVYDYSLEHKTAATETGKTAAKPADKEKPSASPRKQ